MALTTHQNHALAVRFDIQLLPPAFPSWLQPGVHTGAEAKHLPSQYKMNMIPTDITTVINTFSYKAPDKDAPAGEDLAQLRE